MRAHGRAHWRHLANTIEQSICGGDAVLCQSTLTTCYYCHQHRHYHRYRHFPVTPSVLTAVFTARFGHPCLRVVLTCREHEYWQKKTLHDSAFCQHGPWTRVLEYQLRLGVKAGMSPLPGGRCDPIWHVSSSSGVATSVSELLYPCYFTIYFSLLTLHISRVRGPCSRLV